MATLEQLRTRVKKGINDASVQDATIDEVLNQGLQEAAGEVLLPDLAASAALTTSLVTITDIAKSGTDPLVVTAQAHGFVTGDRVLLAGVVGMVEVNAITYVITRVDADNFSLDGTDSSDFTDYVSGGTASVSYVALPSNYQRNVYLVYSRDQADFITMMKSQAKFLDLYPDLDNSADIDRAVVLGSKLWYQPIPTVADTLTIHYYRKPIEMVEGQEPEAIPDHLHYAVLVNFAVKEILSNIGGYGNDIGIRKVMYPYFERLYRNALGAMQRFLGPPDGRPIYTVDTEIYYAG
jgi:hypothetical protein